MPSNPFLKPCGNCDGTGQKGGFLTPKKTCVPCGGTGYGEPNNEYWYKYKYNVLERASGDALASNLPQIESGIAAITALLKAAPTNGNRYSWLLGELYQSKGFILADIAKTQKNQGVLWLEAIDYLRIAEKLGVGDMSPIIKMILSDFRSRCSLDERKEIEALYKVKHPNKEIPS